MAPSLYGFVCVPFICIEFLLNAHLNFILVTREMMYYFILYHGNIIRDNVLSLQQSIFKDVSILGNFLDNHDNARFLNGNSQYTIFYNALVYLIFAQVCSSVYTTLLLW